jgi:hypothetical protein
LVVALARAAVVAETTNSLPIFWALAAESMKQSAVTATARVRMDFMVFM